MKNKMKKWVGYDFGRNGWSENRENHSDAFDQFVRDFRSYMKAEGKRLRLTPLPFKANWFITSGFVLNEKSGKMAYWSISDVRYFKDEWYNHVLYRTAENEKDYTGGSNHFCELPDLMESIMDLTNRE